MNLIWQLSQTSAKCAFSNRAIAFAQVNGFSVTVGDHLELYVVRVNDEFFNVNVAVPEGLLRLRFGGVKHRGQTCLVVRSTHPTTAASRDGFDHDRKANLPRNLQCLLFALHDTVAAGRDGDPGFARAGASGIFVAHRMHRAGRWADELDLAAVANFCEVRILREKPVTGMDRIDVAYFRRAHDAVHLQIAVGTRGGANANRFVGQLHMQRIHVRFGVNRQRPDAQLLTGTDHPQRDFATVRDQNLLEHQLSGLDGEGREEIRVEFVRSLNSHLVPTSLGRAPGRIAQASRSRPQSPQSRRSSPP